MKLNVINDIFWTMLIFNISKSTWYYLIRTKNKIYDETISKENIYKDIFGFNKNKMNLISEYITVKAFVVTPSWNVRNLGHLCFWDDFYCPIHKVIKPVF